MIAPRDLILIKKHIRNKIGNIVIAETYGAKENVMEYYGEVISIGPDCPFKHCLSQGDNILFHRNEGTLIKNCKGEEFYSLQPRAVLGIIENE